MIKNDLEKLGFTLEQYREAKDKYGIVKNLEKEQQEIMSKRITNLLDTHIPDVEEIEDISNKVSKKYIKPPQVTNQIVKETIIKQPIKETVIVNNRVDLKEDPQLQEHLNAISKRIDELQIPTIDDMQKLKIAWKEEWKTDFGDMFEYNINTLNMPNFRKLAMGLQEQIDTNKLIWGNVTGTLSNQTDLQAALDEKWSIIGNSNIVDGTNFLGTTNNVALNFRVNNEKSGRIDSTGSTFFGYQSGNVTVVASTINTAFGFQSLVVNTTGDFNTALGYKVLGDNITGSYNTGGGYETFFRNTGDYNTGFGFRAGYSNVSGSQNVNIGYQAGYSCAGSNSSNNVFIGSNAAQALPFGSENVIIGSNALLLLDKLASQNIAIGYHALENLGQGVGSSYSSNIAIGWESADNQTSGRNCITIGTNIDVIVVPAPNKFNLPPPSPL